MEGEEGRLEVVFVGRRGYSRLRRLFLSILGHGGVDVVGRWFCVRGCSQSIFLESMRVGGDVKTLGVGLDVIRKSLRCGVRRETSNANNSRIEFTHQPHASTWFGSQFSAPAPLPSINIHINYVSALPCLLSLTAM